MYGKKYMGMLRSTFIIDPDGKIARVFPKVQPKKHDDAGEACGRAFLAAKHGAATE